MSAATITNAAFVASVFHALPPNAQTTTISFAGDPGRDNAPWGQRCDVDRMPASANSYVCVSSHYPGTDGVVRRRKENFAALHAVVLDDIGGKVPAESVTLAPSWILETSPANFQWGYVLDTPLADAAAADRLMDAIIAAGLCDPGARGPTARLVRVPVGGNAKPEHLDATGKPFPCRLIEWRADRRYSTAALAAMAQNAVGTPPETALAASDDTRGGEASPNDDTIAEGQRNATLTSLAGSMRRNGCDVNAIAAALILENARRCVPPLPKADVAAIARSVSRYAPHPERIAPVFPVPSSISSEEWGTARSTPACVVQDLFYADVAVRISPGGMGKTTLSVFESIHIVLERPLYGLTIRTPGPVLLVTGEDSREMLVARLRSIAQAMNLSDDDMGIVMRDVRIADVSGAGFKLTEVHGDVVRPAEGVDQIIEACRTIRPVLVVIDPAVSFGVGENRVNDAEQGLIEAARRLRGALNCCVQYVHHSGKANAREKAVDQYAGRGGSAFADGARMVHVLQSLTADEWRKETGDELGIGESGLRLARPKMSYCPPQHDILIKRVGYRFEHVERAATTAQAKRDDAAERIWHLLTSELSQGRYHSRNTAESLDTGLKRGELRAALDWLHASRRIESREVPNPGKGGKRSYLHPIGSPNQNGEAIEKSAENVDSFAESKAAFASPPPIGKKTAANLPPFVLPPSSYGSPDIHGEPMANPANQSEDLI